LATGRQRTGWQINRAKGRGRNSRAVNQPEVDAEVGSAGNAKPALPPEKAKEKIFASALRMLTARARSETQLREKLLAKEWLDHRLIDECIARLKELGYLNDRNFAYNYALSRLHSKSIGRSRLARELAEKKVPREVIEDTLELVFEEVEEDALLQKAVDKFVRLHGQPTDAKTSRKLFAHLMRLGFRYELIAKKLRSRRFDHEEQDIEF
jgi:regulatory protein